MRRSTKVVAGVVILAGSMGITGKVLLGGGENGVDTSRVVSVTRGDLVDRALAVGTIEPDVEVVVKSKVSGVVRRRFVDEGDYVRSGAPLMEIQPDPTPLELVEARRQVELRDIEFAGAGSELQRQRALQAQGLIPVREFESAEQRYEEARLQLQIARERLALLEDGGVSMEHGRVESVVNSPIDGYILERAVQVGDPVVALGTFQEGTVLMRMADMEVLVFRGTVDEIDVGRLTEGMEVELRVGALPGKRVRGMLTRISLQGRRQDNATVFPVEVTLVDTDGARLRAGYSANADVIIARSDDVLLIPERVVHFDEGETWVEVLLPDGSAARRVIETGLSDAIQIEVIHGLEEGDTVLEKPVREIG